MSWGESEDYLWELRTNWGRAVDSNKLNYALAKEREARKLRRHRDEKAKTVSCLKP